jgi:hypothetical protein
MQTKHCVNGKGLWGHLPHKKVGFCDEAKIGRDVTWRSHFFC